MIDFLVTSFALGMFDVIEKGPKASEDFYNRWVEEVKRYVPKDRLLVFSVKEGWAPLCKFLDLPIPDGQYLTHVIMSVD